MTAGGPTILLAAGEPSGDVYGGQLALALRRRWPGARLYGLGGPRMAEAGVELLADVGRLAVMGFAEVAGRLPFFIQLMRRLRRELTRRATDLVIPIDYPGFNLRLARRAHAAGTPVLYYVAPQVWAWHVKRVRQLARDVDRLAVILPFEEEIFRRAGANVRYVGHPLLDEPEAGPTLSALAESAGIAAGSRILGLFPGSRPQEVARHLPVFARAAALLRERHPGLEPVLAAAPTVPADVYRDTDLPLTWSARGLLAHADAAMVKSGTATLEAALAGVPMVIAYRAHPVSFWIARRVVRVEHVGLANLVAGERVVPELLQDEATPEALADALAPLLPGGARREATKAGLARVRAALAPEGGGRPEAAARVVELAAELLARHA